MSTGRLIVGIIALLVAVFAGGCGLLFVVSGIAETSAGRPDYGITVIGFLIGVLPGAIGAFAAWRIFRKKPDAE